MKINYQITVKNQSNDFLKKGYQLNIFFGIGVKNRDWGNITLLTSFNSDDLAFPPYKIYFTDEIIGCLVNKYSDEKIITPTDDHQVLSPNNLYIFNQDNKIEKKSLTSQTFILQNNRRTPLYYALMKNTRKGSESSYKGRIYSVFIIPPNGYLEIQPKSFVILHYSPEKLQEGIIYKSIASGFMPAKINLTEQCPEPMVTFYLDENKWSFSENSQFCTLENLNPDKPLFDYCITDITDDAPSDPDQNLINLSSPVNFQNSQGQYICGSDKGNILYPWQYPVLSGNCTHPTSFKLESNSINQRLEKNAIISIKTENEDDLIDIMGKKHNDRSLLGYFSGFWTDRITQLCCYYWLSYGGYTNWLVQPISESDTFNGFIKKGANVYLQNVASGKYLCHKYIDTKIYLTASDERYPWVITPSIMSS